MSPSSPRPWPIVLFGVLVFLRAFFIMLVIYLPGAQSLASWYHFFLSLMTIALIGVAVGYWKMRRWAPWALGVHAGVFVWVNAGILGHWDAGTLFIHMVGLGVGAVYYRRMT